MSENATPHHAAHVRVAVFVTALALTVAFHYLIAEHFAGVPLAIFAILGVVGVHVVDVFAERPNNTWAYLFLIPVVLSVIAEVLYASMVTQEIALVVIAVSLAFFAYWFTAPRIHFAETPNLWTSTLWVETIWPFKFLRGFFSGIGKGERMRRIAIGVGIALPFLLVISLLFAQADPFFHKALTDLFNVKNLQEYIFKACRDIIVGLFLLGTACAIYTRTHDARKPHAANPASTYDATILSTFLALLNALFILFIIFQAVYFFGGANVITEQGITYAEYARTGFFQLLAVACIVFVISVVVYRSTGMKQWGSRSLALALIVETGIVIASAIRRVLLYVDAYGYTLSRYWALVVIIIIAAVLMTLLVGAIAKVGYAPLAKYTFTAFLVLAPVMLLVDTEGFIARWNVDRFLTGKSERVDIRYLENLSSDAVPAVVELYTAQPKGVRRLVADPETATSVGSLEELGNTLKWKKEWLLEHSKDWRNLVWSDYRALAILGTAIK